MIEHAVGAVGAVLRRIVELTKTALRTYALDPERIEEDANAERRIHQGGYNTRQVWELVQNGSDEQRAPEHEGGRIHVVLVDDCMYCANDGSPISAQGAEVILRMGVSRKRSGEIGRFGVGVKSVLSVTDTPQFFSDTGSFGFDADWSAAQILDAVNGERARRDLDPLESVGRVPVLRLAKPLDEHHERAVDRVLDELRSSGFATVVRLPLVPGAAEKLGRDLISFPRLFQLFSRHVGTVVLEDRRNMPVVRREITVEHDGARHTIRESCAGAKAEVERYRVFVAPHEVTEKVRRGAGELHDRVAIDVSWAVPEYTESKNEPGQFSLPHERGEFWAYFPTKNATTLRGVINAAWKTNEDRQNLLDGSDLNTELLDVAAELVVDSLPALVVPVDPAAYLPALPGRTKESPNWACEYLTGRIWKLAAVRPSLPDQDGVLRVPGDLHIHPEGLPDTAVASWAEYPGRPRNWVHRSVDASGRGRRGKMNHALAEAGIEPESLAAWLEALVEDGSAEASAAAIRIVAHLLDLADVQKIPRRVADEAREARVVLTERHGFVPAAAGRVFRRNGDDGLADDLVYVHRRISDDPGLTAALDRIGIRDADAYGRFHSVLEQGFLGYTDEAWVRFWELERAAGGIEQAEAIADKLPNLPGRLRVKTTAGTFRAAADCFLPGPVVPEDGSRDAAFTVDVRFHVDDLAVLRHLGMSDRPTSGHRPKENSGWYQDYHHWVHSEYCRELNATASRVQLQTVQLSGPPLIGSLHVFVGLSDEGKAAFLNAMPDDGLVQFWTRQIGKSVSTRTRVPSPVRWLVLRDGKVTTSLGLVPVLDAVGPQLDALRSALPVAGISATKAERLGLATRVEDVERRHWAALLDRVKDSTDDAFVGRMYALLVGHARNLVEDVDEVRCRVGKRWELRPRGEVAVAFDEDEYHELVRENHPVLLVDSPDDTARAEFMIRELGMRRVSDVVQRRLWHVPSRPAVPVADEYPPLRMRLGAWMVQKLSVQWCSELEEVVRTPQGTRTKSLTSARQDDTVHMLDSLSAEDALVLLDQEFGWNLGVQGCRTLIEAQRRGQQDSELQARLAAVRDSESLIEKIALLVGDENLRNGLPAGLVASEVAETGVEPDTARLAQLAYHAHDDGVLRVHAKDIGARFDTAPASFDGGSAALRFVTDLGFPDAFAGVRIPAPPMREEAVGPVEFPRLHGYQEEIAARLTGLLRTPGPQRAMLSLPTAAGKTRVASEGAIRWIRESGLPDGPILWVAQTSELCDQAVQSWKFVWEKVGPEQSLVIDRLWTTNSATPVTGRPHLVVATDAKLRVCLGTDEYAWLREAALVFIDEAHVAIAPQYTELLERLGLTHRETSRHLIGLSATPFRNDADRTRRLVQRFGDRRLDKGVFPGDEPIPHLQELGVLARVEHRELVGADIRLETEELGDVKGFLPKSAEQRLAEDEARNKLLIEEIVALPDDWPVLVFATSVGHAKYLAAKLGDKGVRSAAIDSATPLPERRQRIEAFRRGAIRVLTNYGVLSQGFDAPAIRAVVIARPVYSPNDYQQMIGRGLRGSRNGGKDTCLILDVRDNIANYDRDLAFTGFEYLWQKEQR
ncbi:DEAD/DEAH box helicase [Kibdelosporangium phytohabitans]|uniref:Helicase n=1 Tax=Kibdelosporangium phytohabitans TaxID=860235 RepID=A0A0N9I3M5_9PSEU|nr:DEAD/DEAH box helicase [Kibdelosporangium phytohabitans]ALG13361.1 helicase [Kibdelosporangium phytohabitans]MBE1465147.1 superfamily II DNA or RNA helicase [Kibdelosporangium phytohabitans]